MKKGKKAVRVASVALAATLGCGMFTFLSACGTGTRDTLVIMTQELNGLYNPFFSTAGTDMDVVGQTQISMFSTDAGGEIAYGDDEPVVVKDFMKKQVGENWEYYFVLKNGIKFSDGKPLTMNDVLFNMYVYLDPAYTGSTTMYSTDIVGLQKYRTQQALSDSSSQDALLTNRANNLADARISELIKAFQNASDENSSSSTSGNYDADEATVRAYLANYKPSSGYKSALAVNGASTVSDEVARAQLIADYDETLRLFKEELERDFASAKDAYQSAPYINEKDKAKTNESSVDFSNEVVSFMYMEGYITLAYAGETKNNLDYNHIVDENENTGDSVQWKYDNARITTKSAAIDFVYKDKIASELHYILRYWTTGGTLLTNYVGKAKEILLHQQLGEVDLPYPSIEGIRSLGHKVEAKGNMPAWEYAENTITIGETTYPIAKEHNVDGTPKNEGEYDVLRITIEGTDPKAIWNFGFSVAPFHYYSDPSKYTVDISDSEFGVEWGSFDFMQKTIQGTASKDFNEVSKTRIPVGAGPYVATDSKNTDLSKLNDSNFYTDNIVYYKANENFLLGEPKTKKLQYVVVSSSNAIDRLKSDVDFIEPQYTTTNFNTLKDMKDKGGYNYVSSWQLGYGYIGINAGKVPNINLRKAIMSAMNTRLALQYYVTGQAVNIAYPMSLVSWAYPRDGGYDGYDSSNFQKNMIKINNKDYMTFSTDDDAIEKIKRYMDAAGVKAGDSSLKMKFTIAGSNTDHPCYAVFFHAAELLNACGWSVTVEPDLNALTKLATGSLTVWAAAWGSTIDPDMYQVYHKNSTATSVYSWGYREILANQTTYSTEMTIINQLSNLIDDARETDDSAKRASIYAQALDYVLQLAVELPVYQRTTLYAFNSNHINMDTLTVTRDGDSLKGNPYQSPLSRIWEVELVK